MSARATFAADAVPAIRGRLQAGAALAPSTWFRTGGPAEWLARPADADDLVSLLAGRPATMPLTVVGAASNLIVRDGGVPGLVVRLGGAFGGVAVEADGVVGLRALDAALRVERAIEGGSV